MKSQIIRITKIFKFEMAHALKDYDGPCKNIHGHSYLLQVTVAGKPITDEGNPKLGMVMDFGDLKKIVHSLIVEKYDHALVLNSAMDESVKKTISSQFEKVIFTDYQPTSELMIIDFAEQVSAKLPENIKLQHLLLRETANSYAEWRVEDN